MKKVLEIFDLQKHFEKKSPGFWQRLVGGIRNEAPSPEMVRAVDGVSFLIQEGECVGLVGESGSGKSTLLRMIARLSDPTSGQIIFEDAADISSFPASWFATHPDRYKIQMIFQDPTESLNPSFSAFRIIADPLRCLAKIRNKGEITRLVHEVSELVGLPLELLTRFPHQLSGGQKARVGIARAIAVRPKLLLLDEPTTALDVSVQAVILKLLEELRHKLNMSYLFITHDLNVVRLLSDRILVMQSGKIVEEGTVNEIFEHSSHPYTQALLKAIPQTYK